MPSEEDDILREFLIESAENLSRLDQEMVELERNPGRQDLLAGVFRTFHTLKGTCGFLGFDRLQALAHVTEDILNELRQGRRVLDAALTSLILQSVDGIRRILDSIQRGAGEGEVFEADLIGRLKAALVASETQPEPVAVEVHQSEPAASADPLPAGEDLHHDAGFLRLGIALGLRACRTRKRGRGGNEQQGTLGHSIIIPAGA